MQQIIDKLKQSRVELIDARELLAAMEPEEEAALLRLDYLIQWLGELIKDAPGFG